jgi:hypothetical protein
VVTGGIGKAMKIVNLPQIFAFALLCSCGPQQDISLSDAPHAKTLDAKPVAEAYLYGQPVPIDTTLNLLSQVLTSTPMIKGIEQPRSVSIIHSATILTPSEDPQNYLICGDGMELPAADLTGRDLVIDVTIAKEAAKEAGLEVDISIGDSGNGMAIFLTSIPEFTDCDLNPIGLVGWDPYNIILEDRAIINVDQIPEDQSLGTVLALTISMMTGHSSEQSPSLDAQAFDTVPVVGTLFGEQSMRALDSALRQITNDQVVNVDHLDEEIKKVFPAGIQGLPGLDKVLTLITMAGSSKDSPSVDPKKAADVLKDGFVNNSGTIATVATLAGHPEIAAAVSIAAVLLGGNDKQLDPTTTETPQPQQTPTPTAYLPDLAAFLGSTSVDHQQLLLDFKVTKAYLEANFPENLDALRSLLKLAIAQKAAALGVE